MSTGPSWLVMLRDASHAVRVTGETHLSLSLVLDADTGAALGSSVGPTDAEALRGALASAVAALVGSFRPRSPGRVLCEPRIVPTVLRELEGVAPQATVVESRPVDQAEDVFDSLVGHMAGRHQSREFATPADWRLLFVEAHRFLEAAPWERWDDTIELALETRIGGRSAAYVALVLGGAGVQRGLVVYPGTSVPAGLRQWEPGDEVAMPPGTLMFHLDPRSEPPPEYTAKAARYGWPDGSDLVPVFLTVAAEGPGDVGAAEVHQLTLAIAAVLELDLHGPVVHRPGEGISGELRLASGRRAGFAIAQPESTQPPPGASVRAHQVTWDLLPTRTPVVMGSAPSDALIELRKQARIHRPAPPARPRHSSPIVPLVVITPARAGAALAEKVAGEDPFGVVVVESEGRALVVLACAHGAHALMELSAKEPALDRFRHRLRSAKGHHVVMVADQASSRGDGVVFGLFECHQPPPPESQPRTRAPRAPRRRR